MRFVRITTNYSSYLQQFYSKYPELKKADYTTQYQSLMADSFGWADFWDYALKPIRYDCTNFIANAKYLQFAWAKEHEVKIDISNWLENIILKQIQTISPDILFIDDHSTFSEEFISYIREQCSSIKLVLGWCGSPIHDYCVFNSYDIVLSNIPELVAQFQQLGHQCYHLNHAFEPRILEKFSNLKTQSVDFSFIGSIVKTSNYHIEREILLEQLVKETSLEIWSDVSSSSLFKQRLLPFKIVVYDLVQSGKNNSLLYQLLRTIPKIKHFLKMESRPSFTDYLSPFIVAKAHPPVYGMEMYQQLAKSKITFNNHINISSQSASNMRLFEATGVGTCLITDWKNNLTQLFEPDVEVVTYRNINECVDKVEWLLENDDARFAIAQAGQQRTLKDHTFTQRAIQLDEIIRRALST